MSELSELIESQELQVECRHCGWLGLRTVNWIASRRDTNCPTCDGVIVLNTSERRREIAAFRRQVTTLHSQLLGSMSSVIRPVSARPRMQLGLFDLYGRNRNCPSFNDPSTLKRAARVRR